MKSPTQHQMTDIIAEPSDFIEVRYLTRPDGKTVMYVDVNGLTVLRINYIENGQIAISDERSKESNPILPSRFLGSDG